MHVFCHTGDTAAIQLTSDSDSQTCVVEEQILRITCVASNTLFMAWSSNEYIGTSTTLDFNFANRPGNTYTSSKVPTTFATFVNASGPFNNVYNLESQLQIEVLANYTQFTVSCINPGEGSQKNITFVVVGKRLNVHLELIRRQGLILLIPYFRVIRCISLTSAYSLISAYCFVGLNTCC